MLIRYLLILFFGLGSFLSTAQGSLSAAEILHELEKLQNTTRVLYLAAHPDDENTRMISWLENDKHIRTAYLSLTRGDGGQNLIGTELGAKLGVLRTQELMQARKIDGGEQFFTRAVDFGYSKTAAETFKQWDKDEVLADVVWVIRSFQPDIIITRFPADARAGHGHHTASAMLGLEAFDLAADPKAFPEQLTAVKPWQVKRIFWNHSTWWRQNLDSIAAADDNYLVVDVGAYNPLIGMSCNELSSYSRSQHKSQGFGVSVNRGSSKEYLQLLQGEKPNGQLTEGITQGWARYGWKAGDKGLAELVANFDFKTPWNSVPAMLNLLEDSKQINNASIRQWFQESMSTLIASSLGLHLELVANQEYLETNALHEFSLQIVNRSELDLELITITVDGEPLSTKQLPFSLSPNMYKEVPFSLPFKGEISQPYWLKKPYDAMFEVTDQSLRGKAETDPIINVKAYISLNDRTFAVTPPVSFKFTDRVDGEIIRPALAMPKVVVNTSISSLVFVDERVQMLDVEVSTYAEGNFKVNILAEGWTVRPDFLELSGDSEGQRQRFSIEVSPRSDAGQGQLRFELADGTSLMSLSEIDYPHIEKRVVFESAEIDLVKLDLKIKGERVAYIEGAGDKVPEALEQMGYRVDLLGKEELMKVDLSVYQAVVTGIRAYNTQDWLPEMQEILTKYVEQGGNFIVQYNTASRNMRNSSFGLYPFQLSRLRVTEEDAEVEFLLPNHPVLLEPNKLTKADFDNWVQERGLYFASDWDEHYAAPLGWHDDDEPTRAGGLIIAEMGAGAYMYTGISFFRELPASVPGAYRLLANLISYQSAENVE